MSADITDTKSGKQTADLPATQTAQSTELITQMIGSMFGSVGGESISNFAGTKQERWRKTAMCQSSQVMSADDLQDSVFPVECFYAHKVRIAGQSQGEYSDAIRTVMISPDGQMVAFTSDGVAQSLAQLIAVYGLEPWKPAVDIKVDVIKTRKGFKTYVLIPA